MVGGVGRNTTDTFGYAVQKPGLSLWGLGILTQYMVWQTNRVRLDLLAVNGIETVKLGDRAEARYVYRRGYVSKKVAGNTYYLLAPGAALSVRLSAFVSLTAAYRYRLLLGTSNFGTRDQFAGSEFSAGVLLGKRRTTVNK